jgi:hypothetical protein
VGTTGTLRAELRAALQVLEIVDRDVRIRGDRSLVRPRHRGLSHGWATWLGS